jgi:dTDP-4-dehydrorhamnose reductase
VKPQRLTLQRVLRRALKYVIKQLAGERKSLQIVSIRTEFPTFTTDVAQGISRLIKTDRDGLCHLVGNGSANRHEFAQEILRLNGFNKNQTDFLQRAEYAGEKIKIFFNII